MSGEIDCVAPSARFENTFDNMAATPDVNNQTPINTPRKAGGA
ncbi:MAG: hypothetical protein ACD_46C00600G0002, partial [uncultured bacterium]